MKSAVITAAQVFSGIVVALAIEPWLASQFSSSGNPSWISGIIAALISALIVTLIVNFVLARPTISVCWSEFKDTVPLAKLDVRLAAGQTVSSHYQVQISVSAHSAVAAFIIWRLRRNGKVLTITFPNAGVFPAVEDPPCDEGGQPLCKARHESVSFDLRRDTSPRPHWTDAIVSFSPRRHVGDQTSDVHTRLMTSGALAASHYARIVVIDTEVRSIRVREV